MKSSRSLRLASCLALPCALLLTIAAPSARAAAPARISGAAVPDSALAAFDGGFVFPREFTRAWWALSPDQYPPGDGVKSRVTFVSQIVDRKMIEREVKKRHYVLTAVEDQEIARTRASLIQNALFDEVIRNIPEPTPQEIETYMHQQSSLAEIRFVTFADWDKARSWRQRIITGTPLSALDAMIARDGAAFATADTFRLVAAEQIPDTLATVIWRMRPGQASEVHSFAGQPTIILVRKFSPRPLTVKNEPGALKIAMMRKRYDFARQRYRADLAAELDRTFDEEGVNMLLRAHLLLPPRSDVDTLSGTPVMRPNIPLPPIAAADTGHAVARIKGRVITIGEYLVYWGRVQPYARPEVRERASVEAAIDRVAMSDEILRVGIARGLDKQPALVEQVEHMRTGFELDHFFHDEVESKVRVTDAALRKYWAKDPEHYNERASIESHIILLERRGQADSLLAQLHNGASFSAMAQANSMDGATAAQGGKVGVQYRGTQENVGLEDAMFATPIGSLGGPEKTQQGWVIWRVDASTPALKRSYEAAKTMIERDYRTLESDRILRERLDALRSAAHVRIFEDRVTLDLGKNGPWD